MATLVQPSNPMQNNPHNFHSRQQRPQNQQHHQHHNQQNQSQQHHHQQLHHHHHHHHHHHPRHAGAPSYSAAVPIIYEAPGAAQVVQPNVYKQINIIPGLDAENAVVDTGVKIFHPNVNQTQVQGQSGNEYDGKRMRRSIQRRTVDYNASTIQMLKHRLYKRSILQKPVIQPDPLYYTDIVQPRVLLNNPVYSVATRFVRASTNKIRCPVFTVAWTPEGRRVVTGTSSGEFTLWNGLTFNFETILQAHECAVRAMEWSHNDMWLLSGDHNGVIKYWQSNMNNVKMIQAHNDPIRGLSFCPTDNKFVTCSDDGLIKVWDFYRCLEERILRGHGADVKCVGWHPSKCMVASGSKDSQQPLKLWDPRMGGSLATIHSHKSTVMDIHWNKNGNWLLSGSRDRLIKVFDIRVMKEISTFRGHKKEAASVNWHPIYEGMFASGGSDGSIMFWLMGCEKELGCMENAHDGMIWDLKWHPLGHILCSGSNDHTTKFWTRNRPGDKMRDKYNLNVLPAGYEDDYEYEIPNTSQSEDDSSRLDDSMINSNAETPAKCDGNMEKYEKPDLNSPVVKVLLEHSSLEVAKPQKNETPVQIFTVARNSNLLSPMFKIDVTIQQEAIEEVERLEKKREKLLRQGIERTKRRKVALDESSAIAASAPSLLDMNIEVPDFLKGQEWEEGDEPFIEDAKQRAAEMAAAAGEGMEETWNENMNEGPLLDHGTGNGPPFDDGSINFNHPRNAPPHFEGSRFEGHLKEVQNFDGPRRPSFDGTREGPPFDGNQFDIPPNFDPRRGNFHGPPRHDWDNNRPPPRQHPNDNFNGPRFNEPGPPRGSGFSGPTRPGHFGGVPSRGGPPEHFDHPHSGPRLEFPSRPNQEFNDKRRWEDGRRNERWQEDRINR